MARDLPEEIASSSLAPINRTAAQVTRTGTHWNYSPSTAGQVWSDLPLPIKPVATGEDFTGRTFGRLTVVGLSILGKGAAGARWVVRCQCGSYSHKRVKSLREGTSRMCSRCDKLELMRGAQ